MTPRLLVEGPLVPAGVDRAAAEALGARFDSGFGGMLTVLSHHLREARDALGPAEAGAGAERRCEECGVRLAARRRDDRVLCDVCDAHKQKATGRSEVQAFDKLAEDGTLGFLVVDGTDVGARLARCNRLLEYVALSEALLRAFNWDAVLGALAAPGAEVPRDKVLPVLRGGDDLALVLDASAGGGAFAAALAVLDHLARTLPPGIGAGAGLVVTRHLGARPALDLARRLVKSAKLGAHRASLQVARDRPEAHPAGAMFAIDFEVVQGGSVLSEDGDGAGTRLARSTSPRPGELPLDLPADWGAGRLVGLRPLTLERAHKLLDTARAIHSKIGAVYHIREATSEDMLSGLVAALYLLARRRLRVGRGGTLADWLEVPEKAVPGPASDLGYLWRPRSEGDDARWESGIGDLLDIHRIHRMGGIDARRLGGAE